MAKALMTVTRELLDDVSIHDILAYLPDGVKISVGVNHPDYPHCVVYTVEHPSIPEGTKTVTPRFQRESVKGQADVIRFLDWGAS